MTRDTILNASFWMRTVFLIALLWLAFLLGLLSDITPNSHIHNTSARTALIAISLLVWAAPSAVNQVVCKIWNTVTPWKDNPTLIETEIVTILSALVGIPLFSALFLNLGLKDLPRLMPILFAVSLPGSICAYIFQRFHIEKIFAPQENNEALQNETDTKEHKAQGLDPSSLTFLAYLTASMIFALVLATSVCFIIYFKMESQTDNFIPLVSSIFTGCGLTALIIAFGGHTILPLGIKIKNMLNMTSKETRIGIASTWFIGFMAITTLFVIPFGALNIPTSIEAFLASWHLWVTYCLFGLSAFIGGLTLKSFYRPEPLSTVFA